MASVAAVLHRDLALELAGWSAAERAAINAGIMDDVDGSGRVHLSRTKLGDLHTPRLVIGNLRIARAASPRRGGGCARPRPPTRGAAAAYVI